jgi:Flp pilus assembly protein CpaB
MNVLVTLTKPKTKLEKTKLVLENIPVLATGEHVITNSKGKPSPV